MGFNSGFKGLIWNSYLSTIYDHHSSDIPCTWSRITLYLTFHSVERINCVCVLWHFRCSKRSRWPLGLRRGSAAVRLLGLWFRIPPGLGCLSLVSVVCCEVEVSATGRSHVQRSPTECAVYNWMWSSLFDNEEALAPLVMLRHRKIGALKPCDYIVQIKVIMTDQW